MRLWCENYGKTPRVVSADALRLFLSKLCLLLDFVYVYFNSNTPPPPDTHTQTQTHTITAGN